MYFAFIYTNNYYLLGWEKLEYYLQIPRMTNK